MSEVTKPIALDETLQRVAGALEEIADKSGQGLGISGANVGDPIVIAKVDSQGKPLEWLSGHSITKTAMDSVATTNTTYFLGEKLSVDVTLPNSAKIGDMITVVFYSGATAATLSVSGTMLDFDYVPSANSRSEINALWDGTYWTLLANEQAVTA